jgi:hypothetical protein
VVVCSTAAMTPERTRRGAIALALALLAIAAPAAPARADPASGEPATPALVTPAFPGGSGDDGVQFVGPAVGQVVTVIGPTIIGGTVDTPIQVGPGNKT